jgi:microcystin-dependent protein
VATVTGVTKQKVEQLTGEIINGATKSGTTLVFTKANGQTIQVQNAFPPQHMNYSPGQVIMTDRAANPATYMGGGTWIRWGKGRVPVSLDESDASFDTVEEMGGEKSVTLTANQMPAHDHTGQTTGESQPHSHTGYTGAGGEHVHNTLQPHDQGNLQGGGGLTAADNTYWVNPTAPGGFHDHPVQTYNNTTDHVHGIVAQGGGQPHTNLQPYIVCYMWKKTSDATAA